MFYRGGPLRVDVKVTDYLIIKADAMGEAVEAAVVLPDEASPVLFVEVGEVVLNLTSHLLCQLDIGRGRGGRWGLGGRRR